LYKKHSPAHHQTINNADTHSLLYEKRTQTLCSFSYQLCRNDEVITPYQNLLHISGWLFIDQPKHLYYST